LRRFIPALAVPLLRVLALTFRWRVTDHAGITNPAVRRPFIGTFWHNRLLTMPLIFRGFCAPRKGNCLSSPSRDGSIIEGVMKRFGIGCVRGSSSRRGAVAIREMAEILERGEDMAITPDGPRGPVYEVHPGIIKLAQITGVAIVPIHIEYSRYWQIKSWDAFRIPKPFSRIDVVFGPLHEIPAQMDEAAFEAERFRLETVLKESVAGAAA